MVSKRKMKSHFRLQPVPNFISAHFLTKEQRWIERLWGNLRVRSANNPFSFHLCRSVLRNLQPILHVIQSFKGNHMIGSGWRCILERKEPSSPEIYLGGSNILFLWQLPHRFWSHMKVPQVISLVSFWFPPQHSLLSLSGCCGGRKQVWCLFSRQDHIS